MTSPSPATPADALRLARAMGVDLAREPFLAPLVRQLLYTPLPPGWTCEPGPGGRYVNAATGEVRAEHPAWSFFAQRIDALRQQEGLAKHPHAHAAVASKRAQLVLDRGAVVAEPPPSPCWLDFFDRDGRRFYHDFATGARSDQPPSVCVTHLPPVRRDRAPAYKPARAMQTPMSWALRGASPPPARLEFKSWFRESSTHCGFVRRELTVRYRVATREFHVRLSGVAKEYVLSHIVGRRGPLDEWDLRVGATIKLFGKTTTLQQANLATGDWIEGEAKRLKRLQMRLHAELQKFGLAAPESVHTGPPKQTFGDTVQKGGSDLRTLLVGTATLFAELAKVRADLAEAVCSAGGAMRRAPCATHTSPALAATE